jgi:peptidoglycan hydrolase-like protein with peptidoglycan-binding domain
MPRQLWIPQVLRAAGLTVREAPGWESRGTTTFNPVGVMWHHTATGTNWTDQSLTNFLVNGRQDLAGPLCHLQLNRDGSYVVIAAGRANHAGSGSWPGITTGNTSFIGIEAANNGVGEEWPAAQLDAYHRGTAAIVKHINGSVDNVIGHKEWTKRKIDPRGIDMDNARSRVAQLLTEPGGPQAPSAPVAPRPPVTTSRPTLRYLDKNSNVRYLQQRLLAHRFDTGPIDGDFGPRTLTEVHKFQRSRGLVADGIVGRATWAELEKDSGPFSPQPSVIKTTVSAPTPPPPTPAVFNARCVSQTVRRGDRNACVAPLQRRLNALGFNAGTPDGSFGPKTEAAVRSFQSHRKLLTDGVVGPKTWSELQK